MNRLTRLANKYETDKGTTFDYKHGFTEFYEPFLRKYEHPRILELGVGGGGSEKMFDKYYDGDCEIYCVDIMNLGYLFEGKDNIHFFNLDLGNENDVSAFINSLNGLKFDIIIDDASHQPAHQYISLINFSKCLNKGGIFIMEDLHTSFDRSSTNIFYNTPLMFLAGLKFNNFFFSEEEYHDLVDNIEDIIMYNHRNDTPKMSGYNFRSVTAVITFKDR